MCERWWDTFCCALVPHKCTLREPMFSICIIPLPLSLTLATQEATYNPFYAEVAVKLCNYHNRFKFTFQLAFWDEFKVFDDHTVGVLPGLPRGLPPALATALAALAALVFHCMDLRAHVCGSAVNPLTAPHPLFIPFSSPFHVWVPHRPGDYSTCPASLPA